MPFLDIYSHGGKENKSLSLSDFTRALELWCECHYQGNLICCVQVLVNSALNNTDESFTTSVSRAFCNFESISVLQTLITRPCPCHGLHGDNQRGYQSTTTMRKQYVSAVHFVKHYTCHNKWWQTIQNVFNKHYFICLMHVCQMWTLWLVVGPRRIKNSSSLNSLVGPLPSLSPSLLPPPSLDASLRAAAARATGGGGTLVEGWPETRLGPRARPPPAATTSLQTASSRIHLSPSTLANADNDGRHVECKLCGKFC